MSEQFNINYSNYLCLCWYIINNLEFVYLFSCKWCNAVYVRLIQERPQTPVPSLKIYYMISKTEICIRLPIVPNV